MKTSKNIVLFFSILLSVSLTSCSTTLKFKNSAIVPAAEGRVKVTKDDNNNFSLNIKVTNLAEPSRLQPKKELYVVWLVTENNLTKNIGQLNSSTGFFSSLLEGELNTVSPFKPEYVFLTAEDNAGIQYPAGPTVLTTKK